MAAAADPFDSALYDTVSPLPSPSGVVALG